LTVGEGVARAFVEFEPLQAYRLDILGSIAGIVAFSLLSFAGVPPVGWALVVGVLLVLTLVITPAAAAQRLTARPAVALMLSVLIALAATEGGILLSLAQPWPTSFFISAISFSVYVAARVLRR